jgi:hypothetical protein
VEQIQIDVVQLCIRQTLVNTPLGVLVVDALRWNFGSIKELVSWDTGTEQALGRGLLIPISMCRVDMAIARFDRVAHDVLSYICRASDYVSTSHWETSNPNNLAMSMHGTLIYGMIQWSTHV